MDEARIAALIRAAFLVTLQIGGPPLLAALAVGLVMSLVQAITQINEQTLAFVPKVAAVAATLALLGGFMMASLQDFAHLLFDRIVAVGGS